MIVLGLDPGIDRLGWAILVDNSINIELIKYGLITTDRDDTSSERLAEISRDLGELIKQYNPTIVCAEKLFFSVNTKTAMLIAEVRGVIKSVSALNNLRVEEIHPLQLKKRLVGTGKAKKREVQAAVAGLFGIEDGFKTDDVADAIGVAYVGLLEEKGLL